MLKRWEARDGRGFVIKWRIDTLLPVVRRRSKRNPSRYRTSAVVLQRSPLLGSGRGKTMLLFSLSNAARRNGQRVESASDGLGVPCIHPDLTPLQPHSVYQLMQSNIYSDQTFVSCESVYNLSNRAIRGGGIAFGTSACVAHRVWLLSKMGVVEEGSSLDFGSGMEKKRFEVMVCVNSPAREAGCYGSNGPFVIVRKIAGLAVTRAAYQ